MENETSAFEDNFSGVIKRISLFDYIQLMIMTRKNKTIEVKQNKYSGVIQITNGRVTFAKSSTGKLGMDALLEIMLLNNGDFSEIDEDVEFTSNLKDNGNILLQVAEFMDKIKNSEIKAEKIIKKTSADDDKCKTIMENFKKSKLLENWGKSIEGVEEIAVVSIKDKILASSTFHENKEMFLYSLYLTELMKDAISSFKVSKFGKFNELTLASDDYQILMQMINDNFFIGIAISKKAGSLGFVKLELKKLIPQVKNLLN